MSDSDTARSDLAHVLERFPTASILVRRLFLVDRDFRSVCEDYALAQNTLARFQTMPDAQQRPEIADYLSIIDELESEIAALVRKTRGPAESLDR